MRSAEKEHRGERLGKKPGPSPRCVCARITPEIFVQFIAVDYFEDVWQYEHEQRKTKDFKEAKAMENIKRTEEYTENTLCHYRLPNTSTMENLSMQVSAGEGAVLRFGDKVLVTDHAWKGFVAGVYEFIDDEEEFSYVECRLNLISISSETFQDGGSAIQWALQEAVK